MKLTELTWLTIPLFAALAFIVGLAYAAGLWYTMVHQEGVIYVWG